MLRGRNGAADVLYQMGRTVLFYYLGITGSITVIVLADWFGRKAGKASFAGILAQMGQYSLQIYILQRVFVELILTRVYRNITEHIGTGFVESNLPIVTYMYSLLISVLCAGVIFVIAKYGVRGKLRRFLFGR